MRPQKARKAIPATPTDISANSAKSNQAYYQTFNMYRDRQSHGTFWLSLEDESAIIC